MERAVYQARPEIYDREARKRAIFAGGIQPLDDTGDEFLRHRPADNLALKLVALAAPARLKDELDPARTAPSRQSASCGCNPPPPSRRCSRDRPPAARRPGLHLKLTAHAIHDDIKVQLAHPLDDGLAALHIGRDAKRRIFLRKASKGDPHLLLVSLALGLHRNLYHRVGEIHLLKNDRLALLAESLARRHILEPGKSDDIASSRLLHLFAVVGMHEEHPPDALAAVAGGVQHPPARA